MPYSIHASEHALHFLLPHQALFHMIQSLPYYAMLCPVMPCYALLCHADTFLPPIKGVVHTILSLQDLSPSQTCERNI